MAGETRVADSAGLSGADAETPSGADRETGWQPAQWPLPRVAAVDNLADALTGKSFTAGAVRVLSQAAVRPDELRRKLAEPAELRVQGGTLLIAETRLWSAAVVPHPANPREYGRRSYALGGAAANLRVLPEPTSSPGHLAELEILVESPHTLAQRLEDAQSRLRPGRTPRRRRGGGRSAPAPHRRPDDGPAPGRAPLCPSADRRRRFEPHQRGP